MFTKLTNNIRKTNNFMHSSSSSSSSSCDFFLSRRLTSQGVPNCPILCSSFQFTVISQSCPIFEIQALRGLPLALTPLILPSIINSALMSRTVSETLYIRLYNVTPLLESNLMLKLKRRELFFHTDAALNWCSSYLGQRTQTVSVNDQMSGPHAVSCSVPQGSVLGPLEFTAYTEDLDDVIYNNELNRRMYADDTQLMRSTRINGRQSTIERLQACIADIRSWCRSRHLQLNPLKTELIWFGSRTNLRKSEDVY